MFKSKAKLISIGRVVFELVIFALAIVMFFLVDNPYAGALTSLIKAPSFYFILLVDFMVTFVLGYSTTVYNRQRINLISMTVFRYILTLGLGLILNYLLLKERTGIYSYKVLPVALLVTCIISVFWHLILFESQVALKVYQLFYGSNDLISLKNDLSRFSGQVEFQPLQSLYEKRKNKNFVYVIDDTAIDDDFLVYLLRLKMSGFLILTVTQFYEEVLRKLPVNLLNFNSLVFEDGFELNSRQLVRRLKRASDIIISLVVFLLTWPLVLIFGLLHKLESPGPMFYTQTRTGINNQPFTIYKLRSMRVDAETTGAVWAQVNDPRVTRIGKFIRLTRVDELPQLWNVLIGEMSFIGPRPERPEFNAQLSEKIPFYDLRHSVRPGLTGWAQVKYQYGASEADTKEKLQYDLFYIKNYSLLLDLEIIMKTLAVVFLGKGR